MNRIKEDASAFLAAIKEDSTAPVVDQSKMFGEPDKPEETDPKKRRYDDLKRKALLMAKKTRHRGPQSTNSKEESFSDTTSVYSETSSVMSEGP